MRHQFAKSFAAHNSNKIGRLGGLRRAERLVGGIKENHAHEYSMKNLH
jgi:hypothetical protein